jgi:hypothetical protein
LDKQLSSAVTCITSAACVLPTQSFDLESQVRPAVRSLKAANIDITDVWFVITKHLEILRDPIALQRWLDFLSLQVRAGSFTGMPASTWLDSSASQRKEIEAATTHQLWMRAQKKHMAAQVAGVLPGSACCC